MKKRFRRGYDRKSHRGKRTSNLSKRLKTIERKLDSIHTMQKLEQELELLKAQTRKHFRLNPRRRGLRFE